MGLVTKASVTTAGLVALTLCLMAPGPAVAKEKKMKSCVKAERVLMATGKGDKDGDGLSNCAEVKQLGTSPKKADTDGDGLSDAEEVANHTDPLDADSDNDDIDDNDDETPRVQQRMKVFVDKLTCPVPGLPGTLSALGISVVIDETTIFEEGTCADLEALVAAQPAEAQVFAEVGVVEGATGIVTATKVESSEEEHD